MKFKTTKKAIRERYNRILGVGSCNLQHLLKFQEPIAYSTRAEGWACDYYYVDGVLISTGYSPLKSENVTCDYDLARKYDELAKNALLVYRHIDKQKEEVNRCLQEFIEVCKGTASPKMPIRSKEFAGEMIKAMFRDKNND